MAREAFLALGHLVDNLELPLDPFVRSRVAAGGAITEERYAGLLERRRAVIRDFETRFGPDEIMLLPTTPLPAQPFDEVDESVVPMSRLTRLANYLGLCGISVPMGLTSRGLPVGSQLVARGGQEAMLLDTAQALARGAGVRHAQHPG
jgi:aspartyl-tRNA(Asn)/glutamyl-tRNA(Gln) amidotransferase subunit A